MSQNTMTKKHEVSATDLGIDLTSRTEAELFKWFLACLLFGKPIQQQVAQRTYLEFERERLLSPGAIRKAGWKKLVRVLDNGHYVRYDESTATRLLKVMEELEKTDGGLLDLITHAGSEQEVARRLQQFTGVGPKTAEIFLRDLRRSGWTFPPRGESQAHRTSSRAH